MVHYLGEQGGMTAADLPETEELVTDVIGELEEAIGELNAVLTLLRNGSTPTKE